jgi:hypothetical protein
MWIPLWSIPFEELDSALSETEGKAVDKGYSGAGGGLNGEYFSMGERE